MKRVTTTVRTGHVCSVHFSGCVSFEVNRYLSRAITWPLIVMQLVPFSCAFAKGRDACATENRHQEVECVKVILDSSFNWRSPVVVTGAEVAGLQLGIDGIVLAAPEQIAQWQTLTATGPFYSRLFEQSPRQRLLLESRTVNVRISSVRILRGAGSGKPV